MKSIFIYSSLPLAFSLVVLLFTGCGKDDNDPPKVEFTNLPPEVLQLLSQQNLDAGDVLNRFNAGGMPIYEGLQPRTIFFFEDIPSFFDIQHSCIFDSETRSSLDSVYTNYRNIIRVTNNQTSFPAVVSYFSPRDAGSGDGYASGADNNFSIYIVANGTTDSISYRALWVLSGTLIDSANFITGIQNFHDGFLMLSKGADPQNKIASVGTVRIFRDPDGISRRRSGILPGVVGRSMVKN